MLFNIKYYSNHPGSPARNQEVSDASPQSGSTHSTHHSPQHSSSSHPSNLTLVPLSPHCPHVGQDTMTSGWAVTTNGHPLQPSDALQTTVRVISGGAAQAASAPPRGCFTHHYNPVASLSPPPFMTVLKPSLPSPAGLSAPCSLGSPGRQNCPQ